VKRHAVVAVVTALLAFLMFESVAGARSPEEVRDRLVKISPKYAGKRPTAIGYALTPTVILTARHVVYPHCSALGRHVSSCDAAENVGITEYVLQLADGSVPEKTLVVDETIVIKEISGSREEQEAVDVALLVLTEPLPGVKGIATIAGIEDKDLWDSEGVIVAPGPFKPAKIRDPRLRFADGETGGLLSKAITVSLDDKGIAGDSGSPLYSTKFQRVVGVYTGDKFDTKERRWTGVATSINEPKIIALLGEQGVRVAGAAESYPRYDHWVHPSAWIAAAFAFTDRSLAPNFDAFLQGTLGATIDLDHFGPDREHAIGMWLALAGEFASYRYSFVSPANSEQELRDRLPNGTRKWGMVAVGIEAALELRAWRLTWSTFALQFGGRLLHPFYRAPPTIDNDWLMGSLFASLRWFPGTTSGARLGFQVRPSVDWLPHSRFKFTGLDNEITASGVPRSFSLSLGVGLELW
jgi:hypothetical protein